jgi:outer membrane receptor protein involved in Fe transport
MLAGPSALAQSVAASDAAAADAETIVVTGSLIKNPNLDRSSPVTVVGADEIDLQQSNVAEELLREIPGIVPNVGSSVNNGNGGASFVDLRGLGPNRNIVLLDGQRLVPADLTGQFDLNNVPLALIERVDVLTGGASTTYGADAVSGVVNFITKRDFTGVELNGGYGLTERGDGQTLRLDMTMGAGFDDGRGNIVLGVGYQEADQVLQDDRDFSRTSYNSGNGRAEGSGTSVPSRFSGVNPTGTNRIANPADALLPQICNEATPSAERPLVPGLPSCVSGQAGLRQVTNDGTAFRAGNAFDSFNFNPFNVFQTPFKRFNIYAAGRYEVSENLEFYSRAMFSKNKVQTIIAPSGAFGLGGLTVSLNNPFLTTAQRNAFCAFDNDPGVGYTPRFTPGECAAAATAAGRDDPNYREVTGVTAARRNVEGGPRISTYDTTFFDYQVGARGAITSTIDYDVSVNYGESDNTETATGYWLNSRVAQGLLVERGPGGVATCQDTSNGCVPLNLFGAVGSITPEMIDFLQEASTTTLSTSLTQVRGNISGDAGFGIPWASNPIAFAVGAEWRDYSARQAADTLGQSGDLAGAGGADPSINGGLSVYEFFGELIAPLVQDKPFFEDLTFEAGVRYSSYSVDAPGNPTFDAWTYKLGGSWTIGGGVKVRGGYARAVRAPNISELFSPLNFALTNLDDDPCANLDDAGRPLGRPNPSGELLAICLAQGAPADSIGSIALPTAGQANTRTTGNPNNRPETSDSYTLGVVFAPQFAPGLTMTLDYYNIYVTNALTFPTSADVIQNCFGPNPLTPPAGAAASAGCGVIQRNPETGGLDGTLIGGLFQPTSNQGTLHTDGIDFTANYGTEFGQVGWNLAVSGNWTSRNKFQALPASVNRDCTGLYSPDCASIVPEWQFSVRNTVSISDFDLSLLWRYISKTRFETQDAFRGTLSGGNLNGQEADFNFIPAWHIFDLSARFQASETFSLVVAIQNLFDRQPKVVGNTIGSTSFNSGNVYPSTYDALGRRFNVGARINF